MKDDEHNDLVKRIDRALEQYHVLGAKPNARALILLSILEAEGVRLKVKKSEKHARGKK